MAAGPFSELNFIHAAHDAQFFAKLVEQFRRVGAAVDLEEQQLISDGIMGRQIGRTSPITIDIPKSIPAAEFCVGCAGKRGTITF